MSKTSALEETITQVGHRLDNLIRLGDAEGIWPRPILDEGYILRQLFPEGKSSPLKTLTMTYCRIEPVLRFLEENLIPELEDRKAKLEVKTKEVTTSDVVAKN